MSFSAPVAVVIDVRMWQNQAQTLDTEADI